MHPDEVEAPGIETRRSPLEGGRLAVGSRRRALDRLWAAFRGGLGGPVLITGEPGAGKNWLVERFAEGLPAGWRTAEVAIATAFDGLDVLRLAGDPLGLGRPDRLVAARLGLASALREDSDDGRSWLLVVDEAHRASASAWEEFQAQANELGRPGGFAAMILLGRTELARSMASDRRGGWSNRLGLHIHLPPLDLDEARALLRPEGRLTEPELETLHRDAMGNPRAMLRAVAAWGRSPSRPPRPLPHLEPRPTAEAATAAGIPAPADDLRPPRLPALIPARPPIRLEDGLVEVGWEGDLEAELIRAEAPPDEPDVAAAATPSGAEKDEEMVEDRYAALQAWAEWSRNRERPAPPTPPDDPADVGLAADEGEDPGSHPAGTAPDDPGTMAAGSIRVEPPQEFAPYSQLFGRMRHSL